MPGRGRPSPMGGRETGLPDAARLQRVGSAVKSLGPQGQVVKHLSHTRNPDGGITLECPRGEPRPGPHLQVNPLGHTLHTQLWVPSPESTSGEANSLWPPAASSTWRF